MAKRTPEEILAQREAWLARKAAREAGQDVPSQAPRNPGEVAETPAQPEVTEASPEPETAQPAEPEPSQPAAEAPAPAKPQTPKRKKTPEEVRAQREAFLAARAAKAAGKAPAPPAAEAAAPVAAKPAAELAPTAPATAAKVAKPAPKPKAARPAPRKKEAPPVPTDPNLTRRELLNYAWLASIAVFSVQTVGLSLWFAFPNFKAGEFGGEFPIGTAANVLPAVNEVPVPYTDGKFWLVNLDTEGPNGEPREGVLAIYKVCTHLGCLYEWVPVTGRFECPCHGSKFALTGDYLVGPARRSLDRFVIKAVSPDGSVRETDAEGNPLVVNDDEKLIVDTGQRVLGSSDIEPA
jgi:cytochrome b6-f complex iron-sulfur subunit